jgi:hypothetical protein
MGGVLYWHPKKKRKLRFWNESITFMQRDLAIEWTKGSSPNPKIRCLRHTPCGRACACDEYQARTRRTDSTLAVAGRCSSHQSTALCVQCPCIVGHVSRDRSKPSKKKHATRWIHISIPTIELDSVLDRDRLDHVIRCGGFFSFFWRLFYVFMFIFLVFVLIYLLNFALISLGFFSFHFYFFPVHVFEDIH